MEKSELVMQDASTFLLKERNGNECCNKTDSDQETEIPHTIENENYTNFSKESVVGTARQKIK